MFAAACGLKEMMSRMSHVARPATLLRRMPSMLQPRTAACCHTLSRALGTNGAFLTRLRTSPSSTLRYSSLFTMRTDAPSAMMARSMSTSSGDLIHTASEEWQRSCQTSKGPPTPRFPLGAPVECRVGEDEWVAGRVAEHFYREQTWPEKACVPYQVLLDVPEGKEQNAVWAPADIDECIRAALRFRVGDLVQCRLGEDVWVEGKVIKQFHREESWPDGQYAPYQVRLVDAKGAGGAIGLMSSSELIFVPADTDAMVRAASMG